MAQVLYPAYRRYETSRIAANNSMIALLAGAHLASHSLQLMTGSTRMLAEIFPVVPHVDRFNLTVDRARSVLTDAEDHLGAVAVPYAQAVHEDYVTGAVDWIDRLGLRRDPTPGLTVRPWNMHEILFHSASSSPPSPTIEHFHLLREMRNCHIHAAGTPDSRLMNAIAAVVSAGDATWSRLTGRPPASVVIDGKVTFTTGDIIIAFATSKWLARDINDLLLRLVPNGEWARVVVDDYVQSGVADGKFRNSDQWLKALYGYARQLYRPLGVSQNELTVAATALGYWSRPLESLPPKLRPQ